MLRNFVVLAAGLIALDARAEVPGERCAVMVQTNDLVETRFIEGFLVSGSSSPLVLPEGNENADAVLCERSSLALGDDDYRVITELGLPLNVVSGGRVLVLERSSGQFRVRVLRGQLNDEERRALGIALNRAQTLAQSGQP